MSLPPPLPGLLPASFRGIAFFVPDVKSTVGRRVAAHHFPGKDIAAYDDMGRHGERASFDALYVGDDYIAHGRRLQAAFEKPGPGTLVHPWLGAIQAILIEPAEISFSSTELRLVRFSAEFERVAQAERVRAATAPALLAAGQGMAQAARAVIQAVEMRTVSRLRLDASLRVGGRYFDLWRGVGAVRAFVPQVMPSTVSGLAKAVNGLSGGLVDLTADYISSVAPAAGAPKGQAVFSPEQGLDLVLDKARAMVISMTDTPSATDLALSAAVTGDLLACIAPLLERVNPQSRVEALTIRAKATGTFNEFSKGLQGLFETVFAGEVSRLNQAVREIGLRVVADINETIGRLPQTSILKLEQEADGWEIAYRLNGDDLSAVEASYMDLIARNRLRHPAMIEVGDLEILL